MPGTGWKRAFGSWAARAWPCAGGRKGSAVPWMTRAGAVTAVSCPTAAPRTLPRR